MPNPGNLKSHKQVPRQNKPQNRIKHKALTYTHLYIHIFIKNSQEPPFPVQTPKTQAYTKTKQNIWHMRNRPKHSKNPHSKTKRTKQDTGFINSGGKGEKNSREKSATTADEENRKRQQKATAKKPEQESPRNLEKNSKKWWRRLRPLFIGEVSKDTWQRGIGAREGYYSCHHYVPKKLCTFKI